MAKKDFSRVGLSLFLYAVVVIGIQILAQIVLNILYAQGMFDPNNTWITWGATFLPNYLIGVPLAIGMMHRIEKDTYEPESMKFGQLIAFFVMTYPLMYIGNIIGTLLSYVFSGGQAVNQVALLAEETSIVKIIVMVILAPVLEELVFRKTIIDRLGKYGEKTAIIYSALAFGLFHMNLYQFFYAFAFGLIWGYIYVRTHKIQYTMCMHILINFLGSVVAMKAVSKLDMDALNRISTGFTDVETMNRFVSTAGPFMIYFAFVIIMVIVGIILLLINRKKFVFTEKENELPKEGRFKTVYINVGTILFFIVCLVMFVLALLPAGTI